MDGDLRRKDGGVRGRLLQLSLLAPAVALGGALVALTVHCHGLLAAAVAGHRPHVGAATWFAVGGFVMASGVAVAWHCVRLARSVAGPELRLRRALQRARAGGVVAPIRLRRGDLLQGLAADCNELLAALPPSVAAPAARDDARREGAEL